MLIAVFEGSAFWLLAAVGLMLYGWAKIFTAGKNLLEKIDDDNSVRDAAKGGLVRLIDRIFKK